MSNYVSMLLVFAIAYGIFQLSRIQDRQNSTEAKLGALLRHFGIEWGKFAEPSDRVKELARDPHSRTEAIRAYREQTGLELKEAMKVIDGLSREKASEA